jgi:hypothetical protein
VPLAPDPERRGAVVSLLVRATEPDRGRASATYRRVLEGIHGILADAAPGRPVAPETLVLARTNEAFDQEARLRSGRSHGIVHWWRSFFARLSAFIGTKLMDRRIDALGFPGDVYRAEVVANTDFRKFDETLRMVIDVSAEQRSAIERLLEREHDEGHVVFGIHDAPTSIMTCAIANYHGEHVHFVDGSNGGYTLAAKRLKEQLLRDQR